MNSYQDVGIVKQALVQKRIAVVGLSPNPTRDSHRVALYMQQQGFDIVGVNPNETMILGAPCYPSLEAIEGSVGLVDVFRASDAVGPIADSAIAIGAPYLWLQLGVINEPAASKAAANGIGVVMDLCLKIEHARYPDLPPPR